jgi:ABC-type nitrate/sulfonate/bicarbonate transport system substrate-binding protein
MIRPACLAFAVALAVSCAVPSWAADRLVIGHLMGSSGAPIEVMKTQKLADKYGLELEVKGFQDVGAMDRAFVLGELDVNMNLALNQWAAYLNQGHDLVGIFGALHPTGLLVVATGSPYKELKDLVGKRVGVYGLHGTSTAILGVIAHEQLGGGFDIRKGMQLFGSTPPMLTPLLQKGEVDAIMSVPPLVPRMVATGQYRVLLDTNEAARKLMGTGLPFAVIAVTRKTLNARPKALHALNMAWKEAVDHIRKSPESLNGYLNAAGLSTPAELRLAQQTMVPHYMNTWTAKDVEVIRLFWDKELKAGFLETPVKTQNWYTLDLAK